MLSTGISIIIGLIIFATAAIKLFYAQPFIVHVRQFRVLPEKASALIAVLFIELEAGLGVALILSLYLEDLLLFTIGLMALFSVLTIWGMNTDKLKIVAAMVRLFD